MSAQAIVLETVSKVFQTGRVPVAAIQEVSLVIPGGAFRTIAGASGSGKTTLFNLIGGLETPTGGRIRMGDLRLDPLGERELAHYRRHRVGFVFQGNNLIPTLTAFENVEIPLILTGSRQRRQKAAEALAAVGLADKRDRMPHLLSGGEQQRIAIARAVVHAPDLVLADEPTANLDSGSGAAVLKLLKRLNRQLDTTVLFSTHDQRIIDMSDHVLWLSDGRIVRRAD